MEIASGCCIVLAVAMPWFIAMYARHGGDFVNRLLFHDMYDRAFGHVHDTNQGDDVSFRYFVWQLGYATFPWVGIAPLALLRVLRGGYGALEKSTSQLLVLWMFFGFTLFSLIETKFHHYIFPIVPAIAGLVGVYASEMLERFRVSEPHTKQHLRGHPGPRGLAARYEAATLGMSAFLGAGLVVLVGRDFAAKRVDQPSGARLVSLFSYNYEREWPQNLDFSKVLWVFTFLAAGLLLLASWSFARRYAMVLFGGAAAAFTVFCLDDYFMQVAPHWGQRETAIAYLQENKKLPGPIISYQQNWKGENFYFGNHIASFPSTGQPFREYISELRRAKKTKTFYFFVIPNRVSSLSMELNSPRDLTTLTPITLNNKFVLVRATID
jgi:4-amino-4-deoxy-L-arabinose transferase-like glycosyltransferase